MVRLPLPLATLLLGLPRSMSNWGCCFHDADAERHASSLQGLQYIPGILGCPEPCQIRWKLKLQLRTFRCYKCEVANSIRVIKTKKQTSEDVNCGYVAAAQQIVASDWEWGKVHVEPD